MKNKIKNFYNNNKKLVLIFISMFIFSLLFPYSGDDLQWSITDLSLETIKNFSKDIYLNGRYLGNIFAILLTKNKIIRGLIISTTITLIIKIIKNQEKASISVIILLLLLIPKEIFKQSIVWSSGFTNYAISTLFLLLSIIYMQKLFNQKFNIKYIIPSLILSICSGLFIENLTIFLILFIILLNAIYFIKNKKINYNYVVYLIGSIIGGLIMFMHPTYLGILKGTDGYRNIAQSTGIIEKVFHNLNHTILPYSINRPIVIFIIITLLIIIYIVKNNIKTSKTIKTLLSYNILYLTYISLNTINLDWEPLLNLTKIFYLISSIIFIINFIIIINLIFKKSSKNAIYMCFVIIGLLLPLFVVSPLGARNFFMIYILEIILLLEILKISNFKVNKEIKNICNLIIIVLVGYYLSIYGYINIIEHRRDVYILEKVKSNNNNNIIYVPKLPYNDYVWVPDFSANYYAQFYKIKRNIPLNIEFRFIEYSNWKSNYYKK